MILRHYVEIFFILILAFVHAEMYTLLIAASQLAQLNSLTYYISIILAGITSFVFFIIFYKKIEELFSFFKHYKKGKYVMFIFGTLISYFNIILIIFPVPGLIQLITTLLIFERLHRK